MEWHSEIKTLEQLGVSPMPWIAEEIIIKGMVDEKVGIVKSSDQNVMKQLLFCGCRADSHLIASVGDMYDVCRRFVNWEDSVCKTIEPPEMWGGIVNDARKALKKAEGKEKGKDIGLEMLPCPFCGGEMRISRKSPCQEDNKPSYFFCECKRCTYKSGESLGKHAAVKSHNIVAKRCRT